MKWTFLNPPNFKTIYKWFVLVLLLLLQTYSLQAQQSHYKSILKEYKSIADRIIEQAMVNDSAFSHLAYFADNFGPRFSGSQNLESAIDWIVEQMKKNALDNVHTQKVKVPHWVRGEESVTLLQPRYKELPMLGLGGSIGTPRKGITAPVLVVRDFRELREHTDQAKGKIVLFNAPFTSYGETVKYRIRGAIEAAKAGAVASLIRSVTPYSLGTPHTGSSEYQGGIPKIPSAAITLEDAEMLQRFQDRSQPMYLHLKMEAQTLPDANSRNIVAQITGSEHPDEIVVLGGHIDSWDVGQGAIDDAGGCFAAWEALRLIKSLGLKPRRTIRVVMWANEENGLRGARAYYNQVGYDSVQNHVLAIESDGGVFKPIGYGFSGSIHAYQMISAIGYLLNPIEAGRITRGGGGADISPLMRDGVPGMGLITDGSKYFWYHHSEADTIDKLNADDYSKCIASMAVMAYVVADMPQKLPRYSK